MRVIFLGTGEFSLTVLKSVLASRHEVVGVVTQPDKSNARGNKTVFSPIKSHALANGLPLFQFEKISREGIEPLSALNADIMVTSAYGQILSREILALCPHGVINTHASLLPRYRGSSPIQMALLNGDSVIGTTVMQTAYEVDSGEVILQKSITLAGEENSEECFALLADLSATALVEALDAIEDGSAVFTPQNHAEATFCRKLERAEGKLDFTHSAQTLHNKIRAFYGFPSTYCECPYGTLKIIKATIAEGEFEGMPGEVLAARKNKFIVKCGEGALALQTVQGENAKAMSAEAYLAGHKIAVGTVLK